MVATVGTITTVITMPFKAHTTAFCAAPSRAIYYVMPFERLFASALTNDFQGDEGLWFLFGNEIHFSSCVSFHIKQNIYWG